VPLGKIESKYVFSLELGIHGNGKTRLAGDIKQEANSIDVTLQKKENDQFKYLVADIMLRTMCLKKCT
jgi:hypothetical protein